MAFIRRLLCTQAQAHARTPNAQFIGVFCRRSFWAGAPNMELPGPNTMRAGKEIGKLVSPIN